MFSNAWELAYNKIQHPWGLHIQGMVWCERQAEGMASRSTRTSSIQTRLAKSSPGFGHRRQNRVYPDRPSTYICYRWYREEFSCKWYHSVGSYGLVWSWENRMQIGTCLRSLHCLLRSPWEIYQHQWLFLQDLQITPKFVAMMQWKVI